MFSKLKYWINFKKLIEHKEIVHLILMLETSLSGWCRTDTKGSITPAHCLAFIIIHKVLNSSSLVFNFQNQSRKIMKEVIVGEGYDETVMSWHLDNLGQKYSWEKVIPESGIRKLRRVRWQKGSNNLVL